MSDTTHRPQVCVYSKKQNILSIKSSERFCLTARKEEYCMKHFEDLAEFEQKKALKSLKVKCFLILLDYFSDRDTINRRIRDFAKEAFKIDLPISKVVEIPLDLIDSLEEELMLEGLCTKYMSDFCLTLIDVIAHLGEIYHNARCIKIVAG